MSGSIKDSSQRLTTLSGRKKRVRRPSNEPPEAEHICFNQAQVGLRFGHVVVTSAERRYAGTGWNAPYAHCRCVNCGHEAWIHMGSLRRGKSKGCAQCTRPRQIPRWLDRRLTAARGRCTNPSDPAWHRYGGRGIEFRFESVTAAGLWIMEHLGVDQVRSIDRINNDGHYEPGNLRWATRVQQNWNKRTNVREPWTYRAEEWPYEFNTVQRKFQEGWTREQILEQAHEAVRMKRKGWRRIEERLASMTC
jgi:hypothetical protein